MTAAGTPGERAGMVNRLFDEHERSAFPDRFRDEKPAGVDLVLLDANVNGLVSTWQHSSGRLDAAHGAVVHDCRRDLDRVLPRLTDGHERRYVERLREPVRLLPRARC